MVLRSPSAALGDAVTGGVVAGTTFAGQIFRTLMVLHMRDAALWRFLKALRLNGSLGPDQHPVPAHQALICCHRLSGFAFKSCIAQTGLRRLIRSFIAPPQ